MSMYPFFVEYERPRPRPIRLPEHLFNLGLTPQGDQLAILTIPQCHWRDVAAASKDMASTIKEDKEKFQVNVDVQHFSPEEISVKTVDRFLVVEAKHEERQDEHGFVSRSFTRKYALPDGVEADVLTSKLSSDGVLTISAPLRVPPKASNERVVPIIQTGPVKKQIEGQQEG
ncbi:protein lethal(2)essential for life-like [Ostrinia furnacalis]|uniref:protein lethal(2)essential for life-like n=1 Tax=Ostrinia furnacalis TaxID=93504 RepID=UPI00103C746A|nr:protein lethal(2)essential for life-like [Ostrinia furnacalis]